MDMVGFHLRVDAYLGLSKSYKYLFLLLILDLANI